MTTYIKDHVETSSGNIYYFKYGGDRTRPTIIFLHGLSANHTTWDTATEVFRKKGYNIISLDIRGHGLSDKTRRRNLYRFPVFTKDLRAIIEKEHLTEVILIGYSFGGTIALDYASQYPKDVKALVLVSANHVSPFRYSWLSFATSLIASLVNLGGWLMIWQKRRAYYYFDQATGTGYWQTTLRGFITMPISINLWMLSETMNIDFSKTIGTVGCPTLILRGSHDAYFSLKEANNIREKISNSEIISLDDTGHYLASNYQEETIATIATFLKKKNFL
jgi:pimeloyl-ACP methyl ester carboxylesterase